MRELTLIPSIGFCVVHQRAPEESSGGIAIPESLRDKSARFFVVASSEGYYEHGHMVRSELRPGDEVLMSAQAVQTVKQRDGTERRIATIRSVNAPRGMMPDDHIVVLLTDIAGRIPAEHVQAILTPVNLAAPTPAAIKLVTH